MITQALFSVNNSDSLVAVLNRTQNDTVKIKLWNELAYEFRSKNIELAKIYLDSAINLSKKIEFQNGFYDSFSLHAIIEKNKGNYKSSLEYNLKALKYAESAANKEKISSIQNNIGSVYQALGNLSQAIKFYKLSLAFESETKNRANQSIRLYNIGAVYEMMDSLNLASDYYFHSLQIEEELQNSEGIFYALIGLSGVNTRMKKYKNAAEFLDRALQIAIKSKNKLEILIALLEQGNLNKNIYNYDEAILNYKKAILFADSLGFQNEKLEALDKLAYLYKTKKDYNNAFIYLEEYVQLKNTISNVEIQNKISELQSKYEFEKKENIINLLNKEKEFRIMELTHRKKTIYYFLSFGILLLFLFTYKLYENKNSKKIISPKKIIGEKLFIEKPTLKSSIIISIIAGVYFYFYSIFFEPFNYILLPKLWLIFPIAYLFIISGVVTLSLHILVLWDKNILNIKLNSLKFIVIPLIAIFIISTLIWCYISIFDTNPWKINNLGYILTEITLVFIFPFIIILFYVENVISKQYQNNAEILFEKIEEKKVISEAENNITLVSENNKNELTLKQGALLYIKSEDNYCEIMYLNDEKIKKELMRVTLKALEEQLTSCSCMIRCHKSYLVNTNNIERISGNSLGYKLHIKFSGSEIPVSRSFPKDILSSIKSNLS